MTCSSIRFAKKGFRIRGGRRHVGAAGNVGNVLGGSVVRQIISRERTREFVFSSFVQIGTTSENTEIDGKTVFLGAAYG